MARPDKKVVILEGDDWSGLYVDGELVYENHSIPLRMLVEHLQLEIVNVPGEEAWEPYGYHCPRELEVFRKPK